MSTALDPRYLPRYRVQLVCEPSIDLSEVPKMLHSRAVAEYLLPMFAGLDREHFITLAVDKKNRPIALETVAIGQLDAALVHPREVFKSLILHNAAAFVAAHNHPSGDLQPSREDDALTKRLAEAGQLLGITLLDHLVLIESGTYYSYADNGAL